MRTTAFGALAVAEVAKLALAHSSLPAFTLLVG
jgi:hypothetical protein